MKPATIVALALASAVAGVAAWAEPSLAPGTAHAIDGDTLALSGVRVRLDAIDAPELAQACATAAARSYPCGERSRDALARLLAGTTVSCVPVTLDRYGRTVARCSVAGDAARGTASVADLGAEMVRQGWAIPYLKYGGARYQPEADAARAAGRGVWVGSFIEPATWRARVINPINQ